MQAVYSRTRQLDWFVANSVGDQLACRVPELLKAVTPDSVIWAAGAGKYREAFLELIDSFPAGGRVNPIEDQSTMKIHVDKTGYGLAWDLVDRSLAASIGGREWDAWFAVEKRTANLLMAYLAAIVGQCGEERMVPVTDTPDCLSAFTNVPISGAVVEQRLSSIRTAMLAGLLPAPVDLVVPGKLAEFKSKNGRLLRSFRAQVEQRVVAAAAIENHELRERQLELVKGDLSDQVEEIRRRMAENKWQRINLGTLLAVFSAGVGVADATVTHGALTIAGGSLGLTSAVYTAFDGMRTPQELLARPMAYAALPQRAFGVN
jgi:hypothetical protein